MYNFGFSFFQFLNVKFKTRVADHGEVFTNDAVYKFKRYEDASLEYIGINKHKDEDVGGWDITLSKGEYKEVFVEM